MNGGARPRALVAMDKFRGTASASDLSLTVITALEARGWECVSMPISDGGEGFRACFAGPVTFVEAPDAYGVVRSVPVTWIGPFEHRLAVIEAAEIVGRNVPRPSPEQALRASSAGVGYVIKAVQAAGATGVLVGLGGSATSDGGEGCYDVLANELTVPLTAATDVRAEYEGALRYAKQKGVRPEDFEVVTQHLRRVAERFELERGVDVRTVRGAGAAGGLGGALVACGGTIQPGLNVIAEHLDLAKRIASVNLVVTGEGRVDAGSLEGKVIDGLCARLGDTAGVVIGGSVEQATREAWRQRYPGVALVSLTDLYGKRAMTDPLGCITALIGSSTWEGLVPG